VAANEEEIEQEEKAVVVCDDPKPFMRQKQRQRCRMTLMLEVIQPKGDGQAEDWERKETGGQQSAGNYTRNDKKRMTWRINQELRALRLHRQMLWFQVAMFSQC
jgi:hypothetical protein